MKSFYVLFVSLFFLSCSTSTDQIIQDSAPIVKENATFDVILDTDIEYAKGLSHVTLNSVQSTEQSLMLDVYRPNNTSDNRPVYLFIHGGGFISGSRVGGHITNLANYYTSRGWVFISISYRLRDDFGSTPQLWVDFADLFPNSSDTAQVNAIYAAQRDAKAALRWLVANASQYGINTDYITVGGGSAGAITAITAAVSEPEDFRDELNLIEDSTLSTTNLSTSYSIKTIVDHWGSKVALDILEQVYGHQRFDANDPALFIAHGTQDQVVAYSEAEALNAIYTDLNIPVAFYPIQEPGHSLWNATINGKRLEELAFDFMVEQQNLTVE